jgi:AraC family transcriptional regulator, transcriptional activator FtrA
MLRNRRVVAIAYDGLCAFEFGIAVELFGLARPELGVPWYEFTVVAAEEGPIRSIGGISLEAPYDLNRVRRAGTIVLPGWKGPDVVPPAPLLDAIQAAHRRGARVLSICSGVYVLAATGLLDGQAATTHWRYVDHLAAAHPAIDVRPNVLFVDNGQVLTSAGSAAGIDLGLHLIRRDHGAAVAAEVARRLVMPPQREGGQAQYIRPAPRHGDGDDLRMAAALAWAEGHLDEPLSVGVLAAQAHMSVRNFSRRFTEETGTTPLQWIVAQRVRAACELLETTDLPLANVAITVGFGSVETLRHHFRRQLDTSPSSYRATFTRAGVG